MSDIKVALCEDNEIFRESLLQFIDDSPGFSVVCTCSSADDILSLVEKHRPDTILMDIDMPGINGIEATHMVKSHFPLINVLILTVYEDEQKIFDGTSRQVAIKNGLTEVMKEIQGALARKRRENLVERQDVRQHVHDPAGARERGAHDLLEERDRHVDAPE